MKRHGKVIKRAEISIVEGPSVAKTSLWILLLLISMGSTQAAISTKGIEKNLFDVLVMGNFQSGVRGICPSDQKCIVALSQIRCSIDLENKELSKKGNCTFKNKTGQFGVLYNALKLTQQLMVYGGDYSENGAEVKISIKNAICSGEKNKAGQFAKRCQIQK